MAKKVYAGIENFPKRNLPSGYTQVEYIQSSGTQYVNTGFMPNQDTRVVCDMQMVSAPTSGEFVYGCRTSSYTENFIALYSASTASFRIGYGSSLVSVPSTSLTGRYLIDQNKNVCNFGDHVITNTAQDFQTSLNMYLFAANEGGMAKYFAKVKIYSCRIYDDAELIRDFVPCKNSSGVLGLYDLANSAFYTNAGSGTFTAGAVYASIARNSTDIYLGVSAVARKVTSGYVGVGGVARKFYSSEIAIGNSVYIKVNGVSKEFIVANKGIPGYKTGSPDPDYGTSCNGTWLIMKSNLSLHNEGIRWNSSNITYNGDYYNSDIHKYLNSTFYDQIDSGVRGLIRNVTIPYTSGSGDKSVYNSGWYGLSTKIFLPSTAEVGVISGLNDTGLNRPTMTNYEGAPLSYFMNSTNSIRSAFAGGLRSPSILSYSTYEAVFRINSDGSLGLYDCYSIWDFHPIIVLPLDMKVDANYNVIA